MDLLLAYLVVFYCYFGKYRIFTMLGIRADYLWAFVFIFIIAIVVAKRISQRDLVVQIPLLLYLLYSFFQVLRNFNSESLLAGIYIFISCVLYYIFIHAKNIYKTKKLLYVFSFYIALSVIFQWLFPNQASSITRILLSDRNYEINWSGYNNFQNYMSGFATTINSAAYYICILCSLLFTNLILEKKKRILTGFLLSFSVLALLLTQKRTLFISVFVVVIFVVSFGKKSITSKLRAFLFSGLFLLIGLWLIIELVPSFNVFVSRMMNDTDVIAGRGDYYDVMFQWFKSNPVFGVGIGSADSTWSFGGHNCYLQLLSETGIIGFLLFFIVYIFPAINIWKKILCIWNDPILAETKKEELKTSFFSFVMILITLIYALTGNPFYDYMLFFLYILFLSIGSNSTQNALKTK